MSILSTCSFLLVAVALVESLPGGPPNVMSVCQNLIPSGGAPHVAQQGSYGYQVYTNLPLDAEANMYNYTAGGQYTVTIMGNIFRGFVMQARDPANTVIGTFQPQVPATQATVDCSAVNSIGSTATIGHTNNEARVDLNSQTFNWTAPTGADGMVTFMYTLVPRRAEYYGPLSAPPPRPTAPNRTPDQYPVSYRYPSNCVPSSNCQRFVGVARNVVNDGYLDIYMEAYAESWVAAGFSETANMFSADVVVCVYDQASSMVRALDTYNLASPGRGNLLDAQQNVELFNSSRTNSTIQCTLAKRIMGANTPNQDLNLNADYWVIFARGNTGSAGGISGHMPGAANRGVSSSRVNPVTGIVVTPATTTDGVTDGVSSSRVNPVTGIVVTPATMTDGATKLAAPAFLSFLVAAIMFLMKM